MLMKKYTHIRTFHFAKKRYSKIYQHAQKNKCNYLQQNTNIIYGKKQTCLKILNWRTFGEKPNALPLIMCS